MDLSRSQLMPETVLVAGLARSPLLRTVPFYKKVAVRREDIISTRASSPLFRGLGLGILRRHRTSSSTSGRGISSTSSCSRHPWRRQQSAGVSWVRQGSSGTTGAGGLSSSPMCRRHALLLLHLPTAVVPLRVAPRVDPVMRAARSITEEVTTAHRVEETTAHRSLPLRWPRRR